MQARMGEVLYMAASASSAESSPQNKQLAESLKRFCRSIELCDDYLRGYYGLKLVSKALLKLIAVRLTVDEDHGQINCSTAKDFWTRRLGWDGAT
jgi:hypothetical protein